MKRVFFWFHHSYNIFLSEERKGEIFAYDFKGEPSLKHLVEAMRIPHTEVGKTLVNEREVDLSYLAQDGDSIAVYPVIGNRHNLSTNDNSSIIVEARFILDNHLGKLATYLRMLGLDTLYCNNYQDDELAKLAIQEGRILLTRDRGLLMRRSIKNGYFIRSMDAQNQVIEVLQRYDLFNYIRSFQRCLRCNTQLIPIEKASILERLEPLTIKYYNEFCLCPNCDKIYWKGSHYERMQNLIKELTT
jgi:uncharacterized protein